MIWHCFLKWVYYLTQGNALIILISYGKVEVERSFCCLSNKEAVTGREICLQRVVMPEVPELTEDGCPACPLQPACSHATLMALQGSFSWVTCILLHVDSWIETHVVRVKAALQLLMQ